jgi:hypothetical protein
MSQIEKFRQYLFALWQEKVNVMNIETLFDVCGNEYCRLVDFIESYEIKETDLIHHAIYDSYYYFAPSCEINNLLNDLANALSEVIYKVSFFSLFDIMNVHLMQMFLKKINKTQNNIKIIFPSYAPSSSLIIVYFLSSGFLQEKKINESSIETFFNGIINTWINNIFFLSTNCVLFFKDALVKDFDEKTPYELFDSFLSFTLGKTKIIINTDYLYDRYDEDFIKIIEQMKKSACSITDDSLGETINFEGATYLCIKLIVSDDLPMIRIGGILIPNNYLIYWLMMTIIKKTMKNLCYVHDKKKIFIDSELNLITCNESSSLLYFD